MGTVVDAPAVVTENEVRVVHCFSHFPDILDNFNLFAAKAHFH